MRNHLLAILLSGIVLLSLPLHAEEVATATSASLALSTLPEVQFGITQDFVLPVLRGSGPLTQGNNLKVSLNAAVSPLSMNGDLNLTLTPLAFLQFMAGTQVGSGWDAIGMNGLGIQTRATDGSVETSAEPFGGVVWKSWGAALFQFDMAAIIPGDWNHIVFQTRHQAHYRMYTSAGDGEFWTFAGDNPHWSVSRNGWHYYASYMLGYQMPAFPVLKMLGVMAEMDLNFPASRSVSGDELPGWTLSGLFNFQITKNLSAFLLASLETRLNFTSKTADLYYTERVLSDKAQDIAFSRVLALIIYKLR